MTGSPLLGRDGELAELRSTLAVAATGAGSCVVVEGPAGIGKTRLLTAAAGAGAELGLVVASGQATELDRVAPLAALLTALRTSRPPVLNDATWAELREQQGNRFWLLDRLAELVEDYTRSRALLVVLDDVQWADELTALALRTLVPGLRSSPVLWLLARRPLPARSPVHDAVDALLDDGARRLELGPLPDTAAAGLAEHLLGAPPDAAVLALVARAGGNPFLVEELLTALRDGRGQRDGTGLPASFRAAVDRRLRDLSADARRLLEAASVLGRPFTVHEVAGLVGRAAVELLPVVAEAVDAGTLVDNGTELAFRHDLIRESVYGGLSGPVRQVLHREAAAVLQAEGRPAAETAQHLAHAARRGDRQAIEVLHAAVAEVGPAAPGAAAELMVRLLNLLEEHDPSRPAVVAGAVRLLAMAGRASEARELGESALRSELDPPAEASIRLGLAEALTHDGRDTAAVEHARRALALPGVPEPTRAQLLAIQAHALLFVDDADGAEAAGAQAAEVGTACGEHAAAVFGTGACSIASRRRGELEQAVALAGEAVRIGDAAGGEARQRHPRLWLGWALVGADRFAEADAVYEAGEREATELGTAWTAPLWHYHRAVLRLAAGRLDDAVAEAEAGLRVAEQLTARALASPLLATLGQVAMRRDDLTTAGSQLRRARRFVDEGRDTLIDVFWSTALLQDAAGQPEAALSTLAGIYAAFPERLGLLTLDPWAGPQLVRIAQRAEATAEAEAAAAAARVLAERNPEVATPVAAAAHADGLLRGDRAALRDAVRAYRSSPRPLARASALEDAAPVEDGTGRRGAAIEQLEEALRHYADAGAVRDAARVRRGLRRLGVRRRPAVPGGRPAAGWQSLTASEMRVVRLVADGLTNREVAARLFLSPHTVDSHLRHAFTKLGIASRVELTRQAMAHATPQNPVNT